MISNPQRADIGFARVVTREGSRCGVVHANRFITLGTFGFPADTDVKDLLDEWGRVVIDIRREVVAHRLAVLRDAIDVRRLTFAPPIEPVQIFQVAQNYADHARESGEQLPGRPFVFSGLPSALSGARDELRLPAQGRHDWEIELAVVIAARTFAVDPAVATSRIAGYTIANDVTTRDALRRSDIARIDYIAAKNRPTFLPLGPYLVPADQVLVDQLALRLSVNGVTRQDGRSSDMVFSPAELISSISQTTVLFPGDLLLTGTPAGTGHASAEYLCVGDVIEAEISGLGGQRTVCVAAD